MSPSSSFEARSDRGPYPESRFADVDGTTLHLRIWVPKQEATTNGVLLVHGFGGSTFSWRFIGPALAELGYRTVAVDLPGFGYSTRTSVRGSTDASYVRLLWGLIDALEREVPQRVWVLIGHSLGARLVAAMAAERAKRVRRLVLVDAIMYGPPAALPLLGFAPLRWFMGVWARNQLITERGVRRLLDSAYGRAPTEEEVAGYLEPLRVPGTVSAALRFGAGCPELGPEELRRVTAPTLIVWGEQDRWVDVRNALRIFNDIPTGEIYIVPQAGHVPIETHPAEMLERLGEFLRRSNPEAPDRPGHP